MIISTGYFNIDQLIENHDSLKNELGSSGQNIFLQALQFMKSNPVEGFKVTADLPQSHPNHIDTIAGKYLRFEALEYSS